MATARFRTSPDRPTWCGTAVAPTDFSYARIAQQTVLSVTSEADPARLETGVASGVLETARGGKVEIPVKVTRAEGFKGGLPLVPVGLPKEITAAALMLNEQTAEGKIELTITPATKPGLYNLFVSGQTKLAYKRNEQAVAAATAVKTAADAALAEVTAANQTAITAKTAAETLATTNAAALTVATNALTVAQTAVTTADAALKTATDAATAAKTAAANATGDAALAAAATAAEKVAADAAVAQKTAADALVVAQKTMTDADAASKAAEVAKVAATEAATAATAVLTASHCGKSSHR